MPKTTKEYIGRLRELEQEKYPWLVLYQTLAEIFLTRKMDFTRVIVPGQFLQADVFDNTGQFSAYLFASIFLSMMLPDAARTFRLKPNYRIKGVPGVEDYFRFATHQMHEYMEKPKAGLSMAFMEHFLDTGIFGTAGVFTEDNSKNDPEMPLLYDAWGVKNMCISETKQGFVDQVYFIRPLKVKQIITEYSKPGDYIPAKIQEKYNTGKEDEEIDVLVVIEPKNPEKDDLGNLKLGKAGMPVRTVHIAIGEAARLREGGFEEMPVAIGRLFKQLNEPYGRSCGMLAQPDAQSLNVLTEGVLVATEKSLDPPLGVLDDGRLGGGIISTGAGDINVFNTSGRQSDEKPIFPLFTIGEFMQALDQQKQLAAKIAQAFFLDRLLDLNNQTQMTAYETSIRDKIRGEALGGVFSRQEKEVMTPTIERSFNILFRNGYLGVVTKGPGAKLRKSWDAIVGAEKVTVPPVVLKAWQAGLNVFEVEYISPAKRFQQADKLRGLMTATDSALALAGVQPQVLDGLDLDMWLRKVYDLSGGPVEVIRTEQALLKFRAANRQEADKQKQLDQGEQQSNIALKAAQSRQAMGTTPAIPAAAAASAK
jgi:hypothetical protein